MLRVKKALRAKIAGPFKAEALRTGEWTTVDLGDEGIIVGKDFYLVYVQTEDLANSPGLATDEDGEYSGRNWQYTDGSWSKAPSDQGNFMIRALVDYELSVPVITSPKDGFITNQKNAVIEGHPRRIRPFISLTGMKKPEQRKRRQTALSQKKYR